MLFGLFCEHENPYPPGIDRGHIALRTTAKPTARDGGCGAVHHAPRDQQQTHATASWTFLMADLEVSAQPLRPADADKVMRVPLLRRCRCPVQRIAGFALSEAALQAAPFGTLWCARAAGELNRQLPSRALQRRERAMSRAKRPARRAGEARRYQARRASQQRASAIITHAALIVSDNRTVWCWADAGRGRGRGREHGSGHRYRYQDCSGVDARHQHAVAV